MTAPEPTAPQAHRVLTRLGRVLLYLAAATVLLVAAGVVYQLMASPMLPQ